MIEHCLEDFFIGPLVCSSSDLVHVEVPHLSGDICQHHSDHCLFTYFHCLSVVHYTSHPLIKYLNVGFTIVWHQVFHFDVSVPSVWVVIVSLQCTASIRLVLTTLKYHQRRSRVFPSFPIFPHVSFTIAQVLHPPVFPTISCSLPMAIPQHYALPSFPASSSLPSIVSRIPALRQSCLVPGPWFLVFIGVVRLFASRVLLLISEFSTPSACDHYPLSSQSSPVPSLYI